MRVAPKPGQLILDSLTWSDHWRTLLHNRVLGDSVLETVALLREMPLIQRAHHGGEPMWKLLEGFDRFGLRWRGMAFNRHTWSDIQAIMPFATDPIIKTMMDRIRDICPDMDKMSTLGAICRRTSSFMRNGFIIDDFHGVAPNIFALRWALEWAYQAMLFGDLPKPRRTTLGFVGRRMDEVGCFQVYFRRLQTLDVLWKC